MDIEEKMARALCRASGQDPDHNYDPKGIYRTDDIRWRFYIPHVRAMMAELPGNPIYQTFCTEDDPIRQDFWMDVSQEAYEHLKGQDGVRCRAVYPGPVDRVDGEPTLDPVLEIGHALTMAVTSGFPWSASALKQFADAQVALDQIAGEKALAGVSVPDEVGLLSKAYPQPIEHYQRVASNLANLWADGNEGARTCILSELLQAAQPRHVAAPKEPGQ